VLAEYGGWYKAAAVDRSFENNNNNNKQICIAPLGRNFRGAGGRQRISEQRKKKKPGRRGMSLALT